MGILLYDGLPEEYCGYELSTDFRNMINVDLILSDREMNDRDRVVLALAQLYPVIPDDYMKAVEGLQWFYGGGRRAKKQVGEQGPGAIAKKGYDFEEDADYIYSAFCETYQIRLVEIEYMHWWEFIALFKGLPDETMIKKIIYWRTCDLNRIKSKEQKQLVREMRARFPLDEGVDLQGVTQEEMMEKTMRYYDNRIKNKPLS